MSFDDLPDMAFWYPGVVMIPGVDGSEPFGPAAGREEGITGCVP